jgi:ABC-type Fe3+/spermidine/putrescine transport system ATPase subunit
MLLNLESIEKAFDGKAVLRRISFSVAAGEIIVLLGPSGCGKTTLLRVIAGLEVPDNGRVLLQDRDLSGVPVHQRRFGFVFQEYALFPHKDVFQNVAFGLRMLKWTPPQIEARVQQVLDLVGLSGFEKRPIHDLSGGEQQRVALARSLAPAPRLILLDEPLGSLDRALRERLMLELRHILKQAGDMMGQPEGMTAVYVTHDQAEAFAIADRVVVMNNGRVEQIGSPTGLYRHPATPFVARFLGMENILAGEVVAHNPLVVRTSWGDLVVEIDHQPPQVASTLLPGHQVTLLVRPEAAQLVPSETDGRNIISGCMGTVSFRGRYQMATISMPDSDRSSTLKLEFETAVSLPTRNDLVRLRLDPGSMVLLESS